MVDIKQVQLRRQNRLILVDHEEKVAGSSSQRYFDCPIKTSAVGPSRGLLFMQDMIVPAAKGDKANHESGVEMRGRQRLINGSEGP